MVSKASFITKIGPLVSEHKEFLSQLARTKSEQTRIRLLKAATTEQLLAIIEISLNIVRSRFDLKARQLKRLFPYADLVRRISRSRSKRSARKLIVQTGGGIPGFYPALLTPILIELARTITSNPSTPLSTIH